MGTQYFGKKKKKHVNENEKMAHANSETGNSIYFYGRLKSAVDNAVPKVECRRHEPSRAESNRVKSCQIKSNQGKSSQVKVERAKPSQVKPSRAKPRPATFSQVQPRLAKLIQSDSIEWSRYQPGVPIGTSWTELEKKNSDV